MNEELNRFLRGDSVQSCSDQKTSGRGDEHFIDFAFQKVSKVALVQGQQGIALGGQGGDQDGFVFRCDRQERVARRERVGRPFDSILPFQPSLHGAGREFSQISEGFRTAVMGRHEMPSLLWCQHKHQTGERPLRAAGGENHAGIKKNLHALPARSQKASASRSSSVIHALSVASGMSRTGTASAGRKKTPPSRNSTSIMGCSAAFSPKSRRTSGGKVIVPRFDTGIAVMLQCCHAAKLLSTPFPSSVIFDSLAPAQLVRRFSQPAPPSELPIGSLSRPSPSSRFALRANLRFSCLPRHSIVVNSFLLSPLQPPSLLCDLCVLCGQSLSFNSTPKIPL